ncbi:DUF6288 domain-containing protein [Rubritalea profundi]|uniref:PDZ domain-containing protein n=1 Tax=Rubritalea profundi TaxID=1658618 RepID=A0A2S7TZF0_9BACT|nr:DUF6288 domain-containing protein [Rubritalea profundi]PQJ27333.1 hypothetical protein BSZ32_01705 [Rubritalea profundi]
MNNNHTRTLIHIFIIALAVFGGSTLNARFYHAEHSLGPTGLYGITSATNIKIVKVEDKSPGVGKIKAGDVIVGAGGKQFEKDTRTELADAIDAAETDAGKGHLKLMLDGGKSVTLQLKVLGSYSATAPYRCAKTDAIITQTADYIVKSKKYGRGGMNIGLLGLLATGEDKYIEVVKKVIHSAAWAKPNVKFDLTKNNKVWYLAYTTILLSEYYLLTGDKYVLPAIEANAIAAAKGRDGGGMWGHTTAGTEQNDNKGTLHGRLPGYAQMNCTSTPMYLGLILADKSGVRDPEIQAAIKQLHTFYSSFVGRGALPYGVHNPFSKAYDDNGKGASLALAFAAGGDKKGTAFFSRMAVAANKGLERGHTGHFFNQLWTGLGANMSGPEASVAFFKETRWLQTLNRRWDGNFTYDCCSYKNGIYTYRGMSDAGAHLVNYCLGRAKLHITGKGADKSIWLKGKAVDDTIALASLDISGMSNKELFAAFGHEMPQVRGGALWTLRSKNHSYLPQINKMIKNGTPEERRSAVGYFGYKCPPEIVKQASKDLADVMNNKDEDFYLRASAASALAMSGISAYPYYQDMLKMIADDQPKDKLGHLDEAVGRGLSFLCADPFKAGLVKDKKLFYTAARKLIDHPRQSGRGSGLTMIEHMPIEDFHYVGDKIKYIVTDLDRNYHSYHGQGPRTGAITVLANLKIEGGIKHAFAAFDQEGGKYGFKIRMLMAVLPKYGGSAKHALPRLEKMNITTGRFAKQWGAMIKTIETGDASKMVSFDEAMKAR